MRMWQTGLTVLVWGLALGMLMWGSGADVAIQYYLEAHEPLWLNDLARLVSSFGLGRNQVLMCLAVGLAIGFDHVYRTSGPLVAARQLPLWFAGCFHQLWLWLRWRFVYTPLWQGLPRTPRLVLLAIPIFTISGVLNIFAKTVIGRPRPKEVLWHDANPYAHLPFSDAGYMSFPSGHTATTAALAVVIAQLMPVRWRWLAWLWVALVGLSRVLTVTSHYVGDVIAGATFGAIISWALLKAMRVVPQKGVADAR